MGDRYQGHATNPAGPYSDLVAPTLSDTVDDPAGVSQGLVCTGTAGNVSFVTAKGSIITIPIATGWSSGLPMRIKRVRTTGTTATGLYLVYA